MSMRIRDEYYLSVHKGPSEGAMSPPRGLGPASSYNGKNGPSPIKSNDNNLVNILAKRSQYDR